MSPWKLLCSSILNLRMHKLRVFLTMVGIIIGISSVVTILSIGEGLKAKVNQATNTRDSNLITISFESDMQTVIPPFTDQDFREIVQIDGVDKVQKSGSNMSASDKINVEAQYFDKSASLDLDTYAKQNIDLKYGRLITDEDQDFQNFVIIISESHAKRLFGDNVEGCLGKGVKLKNQYFKIIGISNSGEDDIESEEFEYVPEFAKKSLEENSSIYSIDVKVKQGYDVNYVYKDIKQKLHYLHPDLDGEYKKTDPIEIVKAFQQIIGAITNFIAIVSGISLFVGGVGVMNIMYVSVSERSREIGIRRAIGAKPRTILLQFLIEAIIVTSLGGIIGIITGQGIAMLIGMFTSFKPVLTPKILILSSSVSIIIGIIFGIIPASKASKLDPIKAIYN